MKKSKKTCYNCKHRGETFKLSGSTPETYLHCYNPDLYTKEQYKNGDISAWDTLREWWDSCDKFEPKVKVAENA